ncbi:MAG: hypothetical protein GX749_00460 [Ruminococcaceae bacterium]|nr:hypothetical protein [Oscillospiraceae bacterium]
MNQQSNNKGPRGGKEHDRARQAALGGLLSALAMLFISFSAVSPTADFALFTMASLCIAIAVIEYGIRFGTLIYLAVSILASIWPGIALAWPFLAYFGFFPLLKAFSEKRWPRIPAAIFKLTISIAIVLLGVLFFAIPYLQSYVALYGYWFMPAALLFSMAVILVYDYALTLLITIYRQRRR